MVKISVSWFFLFCSMLFATEAAAKNQCRCKYLNSSASGDGDCSLAENLRICKIEYNEFDGALLEFALSFARKQLDNNQGYRVWKSMGEIREHIGNKRPA